MSNILAYIPAAGESQRYRAAGYSIPKPWLNIRYHEMTARMVEHVRYRFPINTHTVVGVQPKYMDLVPKELNPFPIPQTIGQADTVYRFVKHCHSGKSIIIADCDMLLLTADISRMIRYLEFYDVVIAVTQTFDPNASRVDQVPHPQLVIEKEPISEWGIVGVRVFRDVSILTSALEVTLEECKAGGIEPYLSMAINHYPGLKFAHIVHDFVDWGTPDRLLASGATIEG